jgi:hypothetical protein
MSDLLSYFRSTHAKDVSSQTNSLFLHPETHLNAMPFIEEYRLLSNKGASPVNFGTTYSFEVYDNADLVADLWIQLVVPAISGGATNPRFVDYGGLFCLDRIETYHGGVLQNSMRPEEILIYWLRYKTPAQIAALQQLVGGNLSDTARIALGASSQTFYIPVMPWWARSGNPSHFLPIRNIAAKNVVRIDVIFKNANMFLRADSGNPTITMTQLQMLTQYYHVTEPQRQAIASLCATGYNVKMIDSVQKVEGQILLAGATEYVIKLDNLRSPVSELYFIIRNQSDVTTQNGNNFWNLLNCLTWDIEASGTYIVRNGIITSPVNLYIINANKYLGNGQDLVFGWSWSFNSQAADAFLGSFDFTSVTNPILRLDFATAPAVNLQLDIYTYVPNLFFISTQVTRKDFN